MLTKSKLDTIEGTWEEVAGLAPEFTGRRVRITILPDETLPANSQMYLGMFPQLADISDEDIKAAEFGGDTDDGLTVRV